MECNWFMWDKIPTSVFSARLQFADKSGPFKNCHHIWWVQKQQNVIWDNTADVEISVLHWNVLHLVILTEVCDLGHNKNVASAFFSWNNSLASYWKLKMGWLFYFQPSKQKLVSCTNKHTAVIVSAHICVAILLEFSGLQPRWHIWETGPTKCQFAVTRLL